jgi:hypothetical protein
MLVLAFPERLATGRGGPPAPRGASRPAAHADRAASPLAPEATAADAAEHALPVARRASTPDDPALAQQAQAFDNAVRLRSETEREMNALRDLSMEQIKRDDELLKKWITLI